MNRVVWVDDDGSGTSGTVINNAQLQLIYDSIEEGTVPADPTTGDAAVAGDLEVTGLIDLLGGQVTFPATQVPSADAHTLDDYEEGAWTPVGNGITFAATSARYTKVGRMVMFEADVTWPATANGSQARLDSLPFSAAISSSGAIGYNNGGTAVLALIQGTSIYFYTPTGGTIVTNANMSGAIVRVAGSFSV